jgi:hypothetical protein
MYYGCIKGNRDEARRGNMKQCGNYQSVIIIRWIERQGIRQQLGIMKSM